MYSIRCPLRSRLNNRFFFQNIGLPFKKREPFLNLAIIKKLYLSGLNSLLTMKQILVLSVFFISVTCFAQISSARYEKYPVFPQCANIEVDALENCFKNTLQTFVFDNFQVPQKVFSENYKGNVNVLFEVTKEGNFK